MAEKISAEHLFTNTQFGLQRVYSVLNQTDLDGISLSDIEGSYNKLATSDIPFAQYLYQNINQFDSDSNSIISHAEMQNQLSAISSEGLTYNQLLALQENGLAEANSALTKLIEHFKEIDMNNDGKITRKEIDAYNLNQEIDEKVAEYKEFKTSNISIFYADDESSTNTDDAT